MAHALRLIWPAMLGMALARAGLIVASYGSYQSTDEGLFTDGAMLIALVIMAALFLPLMSSKSQISRRARRTFFYICVALETLCIVILSPDPALAVPGWTRLPLCALVTFASSGCQFFWLMRMMRCGGLLAALFAFGTLATSEVIVYIAYLLGDVGYYGAALLVLAQPVLRIVWSKKKEPTKPFEVENNFEFVGFAKDMLDNNKILCIAAIGLALIFFVDGLLRGYPSGNSIAFSHVTRTCYMALTIALSLVIVGAVWYWRLKPISSATFISLELLAALALLFYALFPGSLDIGAVFTTTLNALLCALMWYIVIAFMTFGWRDPYYYALGSWIVCMGGRAVARVMLTRLNLTVQDELAINAIMFATLLISAQALLYGFFRVARDAVLRNAEEHALHEAYLQEQVDELCRKLVDRDLESKPINCTGCGACEQPENAKKAAGDRPVSNSMLSRIMGLDKSVLGESSPQETMRARAQKVGEQFMLSAREVEVLSYYACGWTQKRVAEELCITPATVHAHIKRIYAKTDLHSRQEILDYMEQYCA